VIVAQKILAFFMYYHPIHTKPTAFYAMMA